MSDRLRCVAILLAMAGPAAAAPAASDLAEAQRLARAFGEVARTVGPSVVRISATYAAGDDEEDDSDPGPAVHVDNGGGSGIVLDKIGHILTNHHVIVGALALKVRFLDGRIVRARVVGDDPATDLAVIQVSGVATSPARFGDAERVPIGDWVLAIGDPYGLDHTMTAGILSARHRSGFYLGQIEDFLQTDAAINPGNSGGPLINLAGEVIGVNTMTVGDSGLALAIPASLARPVAEALIRDGRVQRATVGVVVQDVTTEIRASLGDAAPAHGAIVTDVTADSPAERAGVRPADVVTRLGALAIADARDLRLGVLAIPVGRATTLEVWRGGTAVRLVVVPDAMAEAQPDPAAPVERPLGLTLRSVSGRRAVLAGLPRRQRGVVVTAVAAGSSAEEAELAADDVLLEIDLAPVRSPRQALATLARPRAGGHLVRLRRATGVQFAVLAGE